MKRSFFKYERHKILFCLSIILLISIYIIIHDCEIPIIRFHSNAVINIFIEKLFLKSSTDNTYYNIAISYAAAYIFYIVQVYIPSAANNKHGFYLLKNDIIKYINNLKLLVLLTSQLTERKQNELQIIQSITDIYIIEESKNQIFKVTYTETYQNLKRLIIAKYENILANHALNFLDNSFVELLSSIPLDDLFILTDNIYNQKMNFTSIKIKENDSLIKINLNYS